jgi:lipid-binding SYLF domain-containing protein
MKRSMLAVLFRSAGLFGVFATLAVSHPVDAQTAEEARLVDAAAILLAFTANDEESIPADLLERARGIAVIPNVFRGGLIFGARRGRGVVAVKSDRGEWSNPAFITLTGGSFGWQAGAESTELVLIFANDNAVKNMHSGKFTLGGDASAVAGPVGRRAAAAVTFRAEVYGYVRSRGLFAGAAFEGARLAIDKDTNARFYGRSGAEQALAPRSAATPASARRFLATLEQVAAGVASPASSTPTADERAVTFPLE